MTRRYPALALFAVLTASLPLALYRPQVKAQSESGAVLRIEVATFRNTTGTLSCRLFTRPADFPDGDGMSTQRAAISATQASCTFANLAPGTYAVAVVHDENGNGRLDRNVFGIPSEGYGVSNNRTHALSSPRWEESKFSVTAQETLVLRVGLRY